MPEWLTTIFAFFAKLFGLSKPADSHHNQSQQAGAGSFQNQTIVDTGGGDYYAPPQPTQPAISDAARDLILIIEPGGYLEVNDTLSGKRVTYRGPGQAPFELRKQSAPLLAEQYLRSLPDLVEQNIVTATEENKYTLTPVGRELAKTLPHPETTESETFSDIEKDLLRAIKQDSIFTVLRSAGGSKDSIKVRAAGGFRERFHFPDDPLKALAHMEALGFLRDRGYFSQEDDVYRPTVKGYEAAKRLQADSTA